MAYVLKRTTGGGGWVAKPGHPGSYTKNLAFAKKYATREEAIEDSCFENEVPQNIERLLDRARS